MILDTSTALKAASVERVMLADLETFVSPSKGEELTMLNVVTGAGSAMVSNVNEMALVYGLEAKSAKVDAGTSTVYAEL